VGGNERLNEEREKERREGRKEKQICGKNVWL
jgi:hypothetical protein